MTFDVAAFRRQTNGTYVNTLADSVSSGETVTGVEKLGQRFALKLMTRRGSIPYKPAEGCLFMELVTSGRASSEADVFSAFAAATADIAATMAGEETEEDDPAEKFKAAFLRRLTVTPGRLFLDVEVKNQAGEVLGLRLPLVFNVSRG